MPFTYIRRAAVALALLAAAGCTVKNSEAPPLTGPSGLALTLNLNAIPDSISQDGGSQSSIAFADPERELVVVIVCNGWPGEGRHHYQ